MGYTHYWSIKSQPNISWEDHQRCKTLINTVLNKFKNIIQFDSDYPYSPDCFVFFDDNDDDNAIGRLVVRFNGIGDEGHETFLFDSKSRGGFCKTARKPYDTPLCIILLIIKHFYKDSIKVSSDGFSSYIYKKKYKVGDILKPKDLGGSWGIALRDANKLLGTDYKFVVDDVYGEGKYFSYKLNTQE